MERIGNSKDSKFQSFSQEFKFPIKIIQIYYSSRESYIWREQFNRRNVNRKTINIKYTDLTEEVYLIVRNCEECIEEKQIAIMK